MVLHHGIFGFDRLRLGPVVVEQFPGVVRGLESAGYPVVRARVHPTASIAHRARQLKLCILRQLRQRGLRPPVVVVAHSLGGLDARYMVRHLGMSSVVRAVVTLSTPHHGASLAEFWKLHLGERLKVYDVVRALGVDIGAAYELTRPAMAQFNVDTPDCPDVGYFSVVCAVPWQGVRPRLLLSHRIVAREEGDNDGIVSASSAAWGEVLERWEVDHLAALRRDALVRWGRGRRVTPEDYVRLVRRVTAA